jgi:hypothetical protein
MTTVSRSGVRFRLDFYVIMSIVLLALVVFGFSHTVPDDFSTPGFPAFLVVHGAVFAAWILLFVAQPMLVVTGNTQIHRKLGWLGLAIAIAMVGLGEYAVLFGLWSGQLPPFYPHGLFLLRGTIGLATFFGLVIAAIVNRRNPEWHKRLLLCATIVVTLPALERSLPIPAFGAGWPLVVDAIADSIVSIGPIVDLITRGRVHPAYLVGVCAVVLGQATTDLLAPTRIATALLHALGTR